MVGGCFRTTVAGLRSCDREWMALKPKIWTVWPLTESLLNPELRGRRREAQARSPVPGPWEAVGGPGPSHWEAGCLSQNTREL